MSSPPAQRCSLHPLICCDHPSSASQTPLLCALLEPAGFSKHHSVLNPLLRCCFCLNWNFCSSQAQAPGVSGLARRLGTCPVLLLQDSYPCFKSPTDGSETRVKRKKLGHYPTPYNKMYYARRCWRQSLWPWGRQIFPRQDREIMDYKRS